MLIIYLCLATRDVISGWPMHAAILIPGQIRLGQASRGVRSGRDTPLPLRETRNREKF